MNKLSGASDDGAAPAVAIADAADVVAVADGVVANTVDVVGCGAAGVGTVVPHATQSTYRHLQPGNGSLFVSRKQNPTMQERRFRFGGDGTVDIVQDSYVAPPPLGHGGNIVVGCIVVVAGSATVVWLRSTRSQQTRLTAAALTDS